MISEIDLLSLSSTYVVLGDNGDAIPVAVSDRFFEELERKFGDFKGKRLILHFTFDQDRYLRYWGVIKEGGDGFEERLFGEG